MRSCDVWMGKGFETKPAAAPPLATYGVCAMPRSSIGKFESLCLLYNLPKIPTLGAWTQSETRLHRAPVPRRRNSLVATN